MLDKNNCFDRLTYDDFFGLFPHHIRTQLLSKAQVGSRKAGEPVFVKGEDGSWLASVLSGRVRICLHTPDGREMLISMVERGEMFGERAVFDGYPRSGEAIAEEDTTFLIFKREDLLPAMYGSPDAMMYIIKVLCIRMLRYMNTMELYAMQSLPVRLANFLLFHGRKYGKKVDGRIELHFNLNQTDLSRQIASSRESVNRQLKAFAAQGLITMDDEGIAILDKEGLNDLCLNPEKQ